MALVKVMVQVGSDEIATGDEILVVNWNNEIKMFYYAHDYHDAYEAVHNAQLIYKLIEVELPI